MSKWATRSTGVIFIVCLHKGSAEHALFVWTSATGFQGWPPGQCQHVTAVEFSTQNCESDFPLFAGVDSCNPVKQRCHCCHVVHVGCLKCDGRNCPAPRCFCKMRCILFPPSRVNLSKESETQTVTESASVSLSFWVSFSLSLVSLRGFDKG